MLPKVNISKQFSGPYEAFATFDAKVTEATEAADRLAVLPAWWESQCFDEQEQAALTLAERITRIADEHTSPSPSLDVEAALSKPQIAAVTWLAIEMNGWNRIAIASHNPVGP